MTKKDTKTKTKVIHSPEETKSCTAGVRNCTTSRNHLQRPYRVGGHRSYRGKKYPYTSVFVPCQVRNNWICRVCFVLLSYRGPVTRGTELG